MNNVDKNHFNEVLKQIQIARKKAIQSANSTLIELYWNIGKYISQKVALEKWGKGVVKELADFIATEEPGIKGFSARNLWRMKQFYDTYPKLPTVWTVLSWSHHRRIMSLKTEQEREFYLDLLFFHRQLQCLVAFELKTTKFKPKDLGQLEFYLEALDRDVKLPHENPSIGILLCREKDDEIVEYALSRTLSPSIVSEYETKLIPKKLLKQKLNDFYALIELQAENNDA